VATGYFSCHIIVLTHYNRTLRKIQTHKDEALSPESQYEKLYLKLQKASGDGSRSVTQKEKDRISVKLTAATIGEIRLETQLMQHIDAHHTPQCLQICEEMQRHLPLELRDMIYEYVLETKTHPLVQDEFGYFLEGKETTRGWTPENKPDRLLPWISQIGNYGLRHICDKDYIGLDTMQEIAEAYYRGSIFSFDIYSRYDTAPLSQHFFEATDRCTFGLDVAGLMRRLELHLCTKDMAKSPAKVQKDLSSLLRVSRALSITIVFDEYLYEDDEKRLEVTTAITSLFPTLDKLLAAGHMLVVAVHSNYLSDWQFDVSVSRYELEYAWWQRKIQEEWSKALKVYATP
jgi:hypothetical protein